MSSIVPPYASLPAIRSVLFKNPPDAIPPTDELEVLQAELKFIREKALERAKKAGEDLKTIEESMRRIKEKEKGKAKALEKVKRERGSATPLPNGDEARLSAQPSLVQHRTRLPSVPVTPAPPAPAPSFESRKSMPEETKKKKKKRKRDETSDIEPEPHKARKISPLPPHTHPHTTPHTHTPVPKAPKHPSAALFKPAGPDFALPPQVPLLPPRPPVPAPPIAGPSKPTEVMEDFSKLKQPGGQLAVGTFYTNIDPWLRELTEVDLGFLEYAGDEVEPFVMPKLGKHWTEQFEEDDIANYGGPLPSTVAMRAGATVAGPSTGPLPRWEPSTLMETDLLTEERGHGPLTERLLSALIPMQNATEWKGVKAAEEAMEGRPGTNGAAAAAARDKLNVADLEDRIRNVARFHGLLTEIPDYSDTVDDPIATALRHAQRELRTVLATNKARRARLAAVARDRLAYADYSDARSQIDRVLTSLYAKAQKKDGPKAGKKKKKTSAEPNGVVNGTLTGVGALPPCPASVGLGPDEENRLVVPEQIRLLVQMRKQLADGVGVGFEEKEREQPGRIWGLPQTSVYEGMEKEIREELSRLALPQPGPRIQDRLGAGGQDVRTNKGKAKARTDNMEPG
ncbi:histone acetyltransferases subunit 3-domain-containing protein [Amylocystis lapponica]|nr:histone acetyltransferases subunit 3-domain-containing protein [Amylocystis lapponica]